MSLGWHDLRRTVRRRGADALAQVYPFLLRDERLYPQLALAVAYFESMVGRPRADLDGEVLVQFFADHRLARGVVASLARHYRYRRQGFADALDPATVARLAAQDIHGPSALRAALYDDVNEHAGGFAADDARTRAVQRLATRLDLAPDAIEALLVLDADDRAPLVRLAPPPAPAEVAAIYNHLVATAVLRAAARIDLTLAPTTGHRGPRQGTGDAGAFRRALTHHAALAGLRPDHLATVDADHLALLGEQDALGSWTRHGRRLVRALSRALSRHPAAVREGAAVIHARGGPYTCALTPDLLRALHGPLPAEGACGESAESSGVEMGWDPRPEMAVLRRQGAAGDWSLRNWPEALVYPEGVLFPEFALAGSRGVVHVVLVDTPSLAATVARLAPRLAIRQDVLLVGTPAILRTLEPLDVPAVALAEPPGVGGALAPVLAAAGALRPATPSRDATPLDWLLEAVRDAGFLATERALALAGCATETELAGRLAAAGVHDVHLAPGVGLHTETFLRTLADARAGGGVA